MQKVIITSISLCTRSLARRNVCWLKRNVGWHILHFTGSTTSRMGGGAYTEKGD